MRVCITGAASPLGQALTRALIRRGDVVLGQVRRTSGIALMRALGAEPVFEDLLQPRMLIAGMEGCDLVFHLAHFFDFWAEEPSAFQRVNIAGTETVMTAALVAKVPRIVFCSSALAGSVTAFGRSMRIAEDLAACYVARGIDVVMANPSIVVAPDDPGWTGRLIADRITGRRRFASRAPIGWIWVDDAAAALLRVAEQGTTGSRYPLSGELLSERAFLSRISELAGRPKPHVLPRAVALPIAAMTASVARIDRRRPALPLDEARFLAAGLRVDGRAAAATLGFEYTPASQYLPSVVGSYGAERGARYGARSPVSASAA